MTDKPKPIIAILTDRYYAYQAGIVTRLFAELEKAGYGCLCIAGNTLCSGESDAKADTVCNAIYAQISDFNISGIVSLSGTIGHGVELGIVKDFLTSYNIPLVSAGMDVPEINSVYLDELVGMSKIMSHLLSVPSRKRFVFIRGHEDDIYSLEREKIFRNSITQAGLDASHMHYINGDYSLFDTYELISALLEAEKVDCIVAANDVMASSAAQAIKAHGLSIPEDVAVSGFDDTSEATQHSPAISTVRQPLTKMAQTAVTLLLEQIENPLDAEKAAIQSICLPTELIVRRSTQSTQHESVLSDTLNEQTIRKLLTERMDGLEPPDSIALKDITEALWQTIDNGSNELVQLLENIKDDTIAKHTHWWINLADQVQSVSNRLKHYKHHGEHNTLISIAVSTVKERIWSLEMDSNFEHSRLQNYRADFLLSLSSCNNLTDVVGAMQVWLNTTTPNRCFLVQYEKMGSTPHGRAKLLHVYRNNKNEPCAPIEFQSKNILPEHFQDELTQGLLVLNPLYSDNRLYGYMLLDPTDVKLLYNDAAAQSIGNAMRTHFHIEALQEKTNSLESVNAELAYLANHDALTGVANRLQFQRYIENCCADHDSNLELGFTLLFIDLDGFKLINDTLGHNTGDMVLYEVANRLEACIAESQHVNGFISRLGGDEFTAILHPEDKQATTGAIARNILVALSAPYQLDDNKVSISASIGCANFPMDARNAAELIQHADEAMYKAKQNGKNSIVQFSEGMVNDDKNALLLTQELRAALSNNQMQMHYQPRISLRTGKMSSVEALMRWVIPNKESTTVRAHPQDFIKLAEKVGLISQLDTYALHYCCRQAAQWVADGTPIAISVNVSVTQLQQNHFVSTIKEALQRYQLDPRFLELEITESAAMTNVEENIGKLTELKKLGIRLSIDDFGTGYSSLNYLKSLPVDNLKIDRSFLMDIKQSDGGISAGASIVRSVVQLGKGMGFGLVAEGIEHSEQAEFVGSLGCDEVQGFLYSPAVPATEITQLLCQDKQFIDLPLPNRPNKDDRAA